MKRFVKFVPLFVVTMVLVSCQTFKTSTIKETDITGPTIIQKPVIADLDVKEGRVSGSYEGASGLGVDYIKDMATAAALKSVNADVLVESRFEITRSFRKISVVVTGYPATYKNFRPMEAKDTLFIQPAIMINGNDNSRNLDNGENRNKGKIALIVGGSVVVLGGLFFAWLFLL